MQTKAVNDGARQALQEAGGMAGRQAGQVRDAQRRDQARRQLDARARVAANARRAAKDSTAVAYIGEFNSGASAISIPITNEAGLPMISPSNTSIGLTAAAPGTQPGRAREVLPERRRARTSG